MSKKNNYRRYDNSSSIAHQSKKNISKMQTDMNKQKKRDEENLKRTKIFLSKYRFI